MNILVVVEEENYSENLNSMINLIQKLEHYSLHKLNFKSFLKEPWQQETCLVIFKNSMSYEQFIKIKETTKSNFLFFLDSKKLNSEKPSVLISDDSKEEYKITSNEECSFYDEIKLKNNLYQDENQKKVIQTKNGIFFSFFPKFNSTETESLFLKILSLFGMNTKFKKSNLSNLYLFNSKHTLIELLKSNKILDKKRKFTFLESDLIFHTSLVNKEKEEENNTKNHQNIFSVDLKNQEGIDFSIETYLKNLRVKKFSNIVLFGERVTSTQGFLNTNYSLSENLPNGFSFCAHEQIEGKGRRNNYWSSPKGSILNSFILKHYDISTLSIIQHVFSIAIIEAILSKQELDHDKLDIKIKWPNDIYIKKSIKIGGILVNANCVSNDLFVLIIGYGLNLNNQKPTECLNYYLESLNKEFDTNFKTFEVEELMALILNKFEELYEILLNEGFSNTLKKKYYQNWLHQDQIVSIEFENLIKVKIQGIDQFGYLEAIDKNGKKYLLDSDGNSFNMMKNLITKKQ